MGGWNAMALASDRAAMAAIHEEFNSRLLRVELPDRRTTRRSSRRSRRKIAGIRPASCRWPTARDPEQPGAGGWSACWRRLGLLFVLIPTVNLVNINISRIMERASEIGVRKAFGAPARTLVGQFLVENILLTLVGGADRVRAVDRSSCGR